MEDDVEIGQLRTVAGSRASVGAQETGSVYEAKQHLDQHARETAAKSKAEGLA